MTSQCNHRWQLDELPSCPYGWATLSVTWQQQEKPKQMKAKFPNATIELDWQENFRTNSFHNAVCFVYGILPYVIIFFAVVRLLTTYYTKKKSKRARSRCCPNRSGQDQERLMEEANPQEDETGFSTRILSFISFAMLSVMLNETVLKNRFKQARPEFSCVTSCGMPSGHSTLAIGYYFLFFLDNASRVFYNDKEEGHSFNNAEKDCRSWLKKTAERFQFDPVPMAGAQSVGQTYMIFTMTVWTFLLLPVPITRVAIGDHTPVQVLTGSCLGCVEAILFWLALRRLQYVYINKQGSLDWRFKLKLFHDNVLPGLVFRPIWFAKESPFISSTTMKAVDMSFGKDWESEFKEHKDEVLEGESLALLTVCKCDGEEVPWDRDKLVKKGFKEKIPEAPQGKYPLKIKARDKDNERFFHEVDIENVLDFERKMTSASEEVQKHLKIAVRMELCGPGKSTEWMYLDMRTEGDTPEVPEATLAQKKVKMEITAHLPSVATLLEDKKTLCGGRCVLRDHLKADDLNQIFKWYSMNDQAFKEYGASQRFSRGLRAARKVITKDAELERQAELNNYRKELHEMGNREKAWIETEKGLNSKIQELKEKQKKLEKRATAAESEAAALRDQLTS